MVLAFIRDRAALERSIPLDTSRVFINANGERLVESISALLQGIVHRERAFRPADQVRWRNTLDVLIANLALAVVNRVDSRRFVGISFNANDYSGTPHSVLMLARMRDGLAELGLVEGQHGYRRTVEKQVQHGRRTRLRATAALRNMFAANGVTRAAIGWSERRDIIILRQAAIATPLEPPDVRASRSILLHQNERLRSVHIGIPDDAWARIADRYYGNDDDAEERLVAGEEGTQLYRIFKGDWQSGGRLYGGWWINLPKEERKLLTLDGEPVIERDYARLHPTLLFARVGLQLDHDVYTVDGFVGPQVRELGKRTFNRLVNRTSSSPMRLAATALDRAQLPPGARFYDYIAAFTAQLEPIARWFGRGEGVRLQREDSDLALAVLDRLLDQNVLALPVHDSFIVPRRFDRQLKEAMEEAFRGKYGFSPTVR